MLDGLTLQLFLGFLLVQCSPCPPGSAGCRVETLVAAAARRGQCLVSVSNPAPLASLAPRSPELEGPYCSEEEQHRLFDLYHYLHSRIHSTSRPLRLIYHVAEKETLLAWVRQGTFNEASRGVMGPHLPRGAAGPFFLPKRGWRTPYYSLTTVGSGSLQTQAASLTRGSVSPSSGPPQTQGVSLPL